MASNVHRVLQSKTSPAFLHANSTSHTWIFSAFAELIDNAYDPDAAATVLKIDVEDIQNETCLTFMDNGKGMTPDKLHKMLSFGFCEKEEVDGHKPVGQYGNGFKSGSMRLGRDSLVITKTSFTISIGFLSQSYLQKIKAETVLVPIITMNAKTKLFEINPESQDSLDHILKYSILTTKSDLINEISMLDAVDTGTRIIIYNLKKGNDNMYELDFISNPIDIINSEHHEFDAHSMSRMANEYVAEYRKSLREYCSILFLKPRMKIMLRGIKVKTKLISRSLRQSEVDIYKPKFLQKPVKIIFGFVDSKEDCGMMLYNRNRLIKAYERVGPQKQSIGQALGIVGVIEVDFLEPIHNKQDFNKTDRYNSCMYSLGVKLNDYWQEKTQATEIDVEKIAENWTWVQCDNLNCLKWRRLPEGANMLLPDKWFCYMNQDPTHNRCDIEEEPEDEDALLKKKSTCTYEKTVKKKKNLQTLKQQLSAQQLKEELRLREEQLMKIKEEKEKQTAESEIKVNKLAEELEHARKKQLEQEALIQILSVQSDNNLISSSSDPATNSNNTQTVQKSLNHNSRTTTQSNGKGAGLNCKRKKEDELILLDSAIRELVENDEETSVVDENEKTNNVLNGKYIDKTSLEIKRKRPKKNNDIIVIHSDEESNDEISNVDIKSEIESSSDNENTEDEELTTEEDVTDINSKDNPPKRMKMAIVIKKKPNTNPIHKHSEISEIQDDNKQTKTLPTNWESDDVILNGIHKDETKIKQDEYELETLKKHLRDLRVNVSKLLQFMLPELEAIKKMKLEDVDAILVGVLNANENAEKNA